ncbi:MAG: potassium transporter [Gammaproteobacteria bacterium]|nr:potassium transporter [Gammaproteobacteria bacterium]NIR81797.1 potassium transporter [Gammaproteobacteria bacterium]NIR88629.1 potassium transporter [Gammaproteobacteria bacterium]NIU02905.1 potassium transporter [Gammaproteobacteria bacterium]NIV50426.1 potassium transporter [Gammaproteobacteria bacterium]
MRFLAVQRILGLLLSLFSLTMLPPMFVSWWVSDGALPAFLGALALILAAGLALFLPVLRLQRELRVRDGFIVVVLFWSGLSLCGAVPFMLADDPHMSLADAVFESVSGLTTTGATVMTGIDGLPPSILFYRQLLQWLGGMGIIVLAVAVLPMLGVGGMQLYRAETPGPMKENKLTPRITETAKALWYIYLGLTIACAGAYWLAGMSPFDAFGHAFSTVAIGGFSTHDASLGYFDNPYVESIAVFFMALAGMNFALHFLAWRSLSVRPYLGDSELKTYLFLLGCIAIISSTYLYVSGTFGSFVTALRYGLFQTVSISTTTGYTTSGYHTWPSFLPVLLLFASFVGGCAGSTGGGLKVIRVLLLFRQGLREIMRLIHPNAQVPVKVGAAVMPYRVVDAVWGFFATYVATFTIMLLALMATGLDQVTAFSAVAACMNNLGPGLGAVAAHYGDISALAKGILAFAMVLGRLEVFTFLVILSPAFWRS